MQRADLPQGYATGRFTAGECNGQLDGNGGMLSAVARRLLMDQVDLMDQMDKMGGATGYPVGLLVAVFFGSGEELPLG